MSHYGCLLFYIYYFCSRFRVIEMAPKDCVVVDDASVVAVREWDF